MTLEEVKTLSLREKLQIMDTIWEDLRGHVEESDIPQSHKDLLDVRRQRVATGQSIIRDWDDVKEKIGRE